jgi:Flp pilus assembly protein TadB
MKYGVAGAVAVVLSVLWPPVLVFAGGAVVTFFVMALYIVLSGLDREGAQRANFAEAWRRVHGTALRSGLIRAEARRQVAVEDEAARIRSKR